MFVANDSKFRCSELESFNSDSTSVYEITHIVNIKAQQIFISKHIYVTHTNFVCKLERNYNIKNALSTKLNKKTESPNFFQ